MENPKPGSKALDQHGIALNFEVMLAAITCLFSFTYGTCRCPGWGRVEQGGSPLSAVSAGCRGKGFCAAKFTGGRLTLGVGHCRGWGPNADLQKGLIPPTLPQGLCGTLCWGSFLLPAVLNLCSLLEQGVYAWRQKMVISCSYLTSLSCAGLL